MKDYEIVLDYFMGVGGSLLGASMSNRKAIGIDLNQEYIAAYKKASEKYKYPLHIGLTESGIGNEALIKSSKVVSLGFPGLHGSSIAF